MPSKPRDRTGEVYGRLSVIRLSERRTAAGNAYWWCRCQCGQEREVASDSLSHKIRKKKNVTECRECAREYATEGVCEKNDREEKQRRIEATTTRKQLNGVVPNDWLELPLTDAHARELGKKHGEVDFPSKLIKDALVDNSYKMTFQDSSGDEATGTSPFFGMHQGVRHDDQDGNNITNIDPDELKQNVIKSIGEFIQKKQGEYDFLETAINEGGDGRGSLDPDDINYRYLFRYFKDNITPTPSDEKVKELISALQEDQFFADYKTEYEYFFYRLQMSGNKGCILVSTGQNEGTKLSQLEMFDEVHNKSVAFNEFNISSLSNNQYSLVSIKGSKGDRKLSFETYNQNGNLLYSKSFHENDF